MSKQTHKEFMTAHNKIVIAEHEAHDFVVELCKSKNIKLTRKQEGRTGHCEIAEIWTFEKPILLTKEDLIRIKQLKSLSFTQEIGADKKVYATEFVRSAGWCIYEIDKHDDSRYFNG